MRIVPLIIGGWIVFDGVGSIIIYWKQTAKEHLIRVVRIVAGIILVATSI